MAGAIYIVKHEGEAKLAVMARPRGGDWLRDDLVEVAGRGFDAVVSLLEEDEASDLELAGEAETCGRLGLKFVHLPIPDRCVPSNTNEAMRALSSLAELWRAGKSIVVHCRMGLGRAPMVAACVLVARGESVERAIAAVAAARGTPVPETQEQCEWIRQFAESSVWKTSDS